MTVFSILLYPGGQMGLVKYDLHMTVERFVSFTENEDDEKFIRR